MSFKTILYEVNENKIATITLNRPENFNAISKELAGEFGRALQLAGQDETVRVLIITGSGKAFCAGGDLAWLMSSDDNLKKREILDHASRVATLLDSFTKPVIAAVNGTVAGAGTAIALACDIVIASDQAKFAPNFVNIAAVPDSGASWFLPRKVGYHKAAELMLTGQLLDAQEALRLGIFNRVVPGAEFAGYVEKLALRLATGPQNAISYIKQMLKLSSRNTLASQLEIEASLQLMALSDSDFQEGVQAFLQKRKPNFK
ncbi:2-(1,2-epoxy-1,2-dihydrophenyl)acetyl-CoA isomerase [Desulfotomaculum arcticum]|uniref:2-(1,2-epoxy-1,2-dihydrophenyl)acetyl-CoA isomerase n=1 Tax=Desulfotruncus arcticus DSM 17038 TaxID=1121424 RepID=A0A1I2QKD1_9FIRM|nr:enoyl-CoA hydratase [Desulfotruncus arcticus]SFG26156.1 2-(1,2-epoxy-1,2-dihydrophenyl)acetyl-CoA isomerase [Desulfotomaculum arcticum] [Desulfotruncus arcticus DSM 17038]